MNFEILYGAIDKTESYRKTLIFVCQSNRKYSISGKYSISIWMTLGVCSAP